MVEPLRHRQTKGAATDMPGLPPPRHIPTLPEMLITGVGYLPARHLPRHKRPVQSDAKPHTELVVRETGFAEIVRHG